MIRREDTPGAIIVLVCVAIVGAIFYQILFGPRYKCVQSHTEFIAAVDDMLIPTVDLTTGMTTISIIPGSPAHYDTVCDQWERLLEAE